MSQLGINFAMGNRYPCTFANWLGQSWNLAICPGLPDLVAMSRNTVMKISDLQYYYCSIEAEKQFGFRFDHYYCACNCFITSRDIMTH